MKFAKNNLDDQLDAWDGDIPAGREKTQPYETKDGAGVRAERAAKINDGVSGLAVISEHTAALLLNACEWDLNRLRHGRRESKALPQSGPAWISVRQHRCSWARRVPNHAAHAAHAQSCVRPMRPPCPRRVPSLQCGLARAEQRPHEDAEGLCPARVSRDLAGTNRHVGTYREPPTGGCGHPGDVQAARASGAASDGGRGIAIG